VGYTDENGTYRNFNLNVIDEDYVPTLKMELTQGRNFSMNNPADKKNTIIINESLAKEYGWTDAVGKKLPGKRFLDHEIIGVVKDFNFSSLYTKIQPLVLVQDPAIILSGVQNISINTSPIPKLIFRIQPGKVQEGIKSVKEAWNKLEQGEEFKFSFVDQKLDAQYKSDQNLGKIVSVATLLSILIGSLGLYALASLAMQNRTKEISIRKVMGATEKSLLLLLSKDYVLLLLISLLISAPITFYVMDQWLLTFEYRIGINWNVFALAGIIALVITITTISYQAIKTAWTKPADTLKYE
jgi:putative ABC transport system permease protein